MPWEKDIFCCHWFLVDGIFSGRQFWTMSKKASNLRNFRKLMTATNVGWGETKQNRPFQIPVKRRTMLLFFHTKKAKQIQKKEDARSTLACFLTFNVVNIVSYKKSIVKKSVIGNWNNILQPTFEWVCLNVYFKTSYMWKTSLGHRKVVLDNDNNLWHHTKLPKIVGSMKL